MATIFDDLDEVGLLRREDVEPRKNAADELTEMLRDAFHPQPTAGDLGSPRPLGRGLARK